MKGKEYLYPLGSFFDPAKGILIQPSVCVKGENTTQVAIHLTTKESILNCSNLERGNLCTIDKRRCGIKRKISSRSNQEQDNFEILSNLPSVMEMVNLTIKLRGLLTEGKTRFVPGQGFTVVSDITYPDGDSGELGWSRIHDEIGALIWTKGSAKLREGDYCVIYVDPYEPNIKVVELRDKGEKVSGIDWDDLQDLRSLIHEDKKE